MQVMIIRENDISSAHYDEMIGVIYVDMKASVEHLPFGCQHYYQRTDYRILNSQ